MCGHAAGAPSISQSGIPVSAEAGSPITVWVEVSSTTPVDGALLYYSNPEAGLMDYLAMNLTSGNATDGRWSCDIPAQSWEGTVECRVTVTDLAGASAQYPATGEAVIRISGEDEPKPFPWNLALVMAFLAVALVLTELVFKPGLYRKTGRQKARELEEADRACESRDGDQEGS
jgi:hypothetical protein